MSVVGAQRLSFYHDDNTDHAFRRYSTIYKHRKNRSKLQFPCSLPPFLQSVFPRSIKWTPKQGQWGALDGSLVWIHFGRYAIYRVVIGGTSCCWAQFLPLDALRMILDSSRNRCHAFSMSSALGEAAPHKVPWMINNQWLTAWISDSKSCSRPSKCQSIYISVRW